VAESKQPTHVTVAGTGTVWIAPEGTAFPVGLTAPIAPWLDAGYTSEDGVTLTLSRDQEEINAWQSADPVRVLITAEPKTIAFELLEFDRESIALAFRGGTWVDVPGPPAYYTYTPPAAGALDVRAMCIDGLDGAYKFRFNYPRVQLQGDVETSLVRTDAVRLPLEFAVLASTPSWSIVGDLPGFTTTGLVAATAMPRTHAELDALAAELGVDLTGATTITEKQEALEAAGVTPAGATA
jgi:hypothetical protein